jgi:hypothetical protein
VRSRLLAAVATMSRGRPPDGVGRIITDGLRRPAGWPRRPAFLIISCLALAVAVGGVAAEPASAGHGSWTHHDNHVSEVGASNYSGYADVAGRYKYDYGHARFTVLGSGGGIIRNETVTCSGNELCGYRKTYTVNWPQGRSTARSAACARDGTHKLDGVGAYYSQCSSYRLDTHRHDRSLS